MPPGQLDIGTGYGRKAPTYLRGPDRGRSAARRWASCCAATGIRSGSPRMPPTTPREVRVLGEDLILFRDKTGPAGPGACALRASRHHALLRQGRGARHPLLLSRLAVRRRRPLPGAALRAGGRPVPRPRAPALVPGARTIRPDLRLHGPAREEAGAAALRVPGDPRRGRVPGCRRHQHRQRRRRHRALQLAAAFRERAGHLSRPHPAREFQRHAVHRSDEPDAQGDLGLYRARRKSLLDAHAGGRKAHAAHDRGGAAHPACRAQPVRRRLRPRRKHRLDAADRRRPLSHLHRRPRAREGRVPAQGRGRRDRPQMARHDAGGATGRSGRLGSADRPGHDRLSLRRAPRDQRPGRGDAAAAAAPPGGRGRARTRIPWA